MKTVAGWLEKGVARVIIGTAAVEDPGFVREASRLFPGRIAVGIDARDGRVAVDGWARTSDVVGGRPRPPFRGRRRRGAHLHRHRARRRDAGPQCRRDRRARRGGRRSRSSPRAGSPRSTTFRRLLEPDCARLAGAITGRALYDGRLDPREALALIRAAEARPCLRPASSPASTSRTAASSRASISSTCATPAIRSKAPSPTTRPAPTNSASSTSPRATRTAARCSTSSAAPPKSASCR